MSRVINGGNVAANYKIFAVYLREHFRELLENKKPEEIPKRLRSEWDELFKDADNSFYFESKESLRNAPEEFSLAKHGVYSASMRLVIDSYMKVKKIDGEKMIDCRRAIKEVRDLTEKLLAVKTFSRNDRKLAEFLKAFYEEVFRRGEEDDSCETFCGIAGTYSYGTRDFDDDD